MKPENTAKETIRTGQAVNIAKWMCFISPGKYQVSDFMWQLLTLDVFHGIGNTGN